MNTGKTSANSTAIGRGSRAPDGELPADGSRLGCVVAASSSSSRCPPRTRTCTREDKLDDRSLQKSLHERYFWHYAVLRRAGRPSAWNLTGERNGKPERVGPSRRGRATWRQMPPRPGTKWGWPVAATLATISNHEATPRDRLWALAGLYVGNLVERLTGIGLTTAVMAAFAVAGIYLAVRLRTQRHPRRALQSRPRSRTGASMGEAWPDARPFRAPRTKVATPKARLLRVSRRRSSSGAFTVATHSRARSPRRRRKRRSGELGSAACPAQLGEKSSRGTRRRSLCSAGLWARPRSRRENRES